MSAPKELKYSKDHEWVRVEGKVATVGITEFAQSELGDIVFIDLPAIGKVLEKGGVVCVVESTKAASDVYTPVSGTVKEVNKTLSDAPSRINEKPYEEGWMVRLEISKPADLDSLMTAEAYEAYLKSK